MKSASAEKDSLLHPEGFWVQALDLVRKAFDLETARNTGEAIKTHERALSLFAKAKETAFGSELATLERLITHHDETVKILRRLHKLRFDGSSAASEATSTDESTLISSKRGSKKSKHSESGPDSGSYELIDINRGTNSIQKSTSLSPSHLTTLNVLLSECSKIALEMRKVRRKPESTEVTFEIEVNQEKQQVDLQRMIDALSLRLATCKYILNPTVASPRDPSSSDYKREAIDMTAVALEVSSTAHETSSLSQPSSHGISSKSNAKDSVFEILVRQINEQIQQRIEEARTELAEDDLSGLRKLHSSQVLTEEADIDEERESKDEIENSVSFAAIASGSKLVQGDIVVPKSASKMVESKSELRFTETLKDTTESKKDSGNTVSQRAAAGSSSTSASPISVNSSSAVGDQIHLTRNVQRAHSLLQEEGPLSTRERQSLLSEFNRTHFSKKWLGSSESSLDDEAKNTLSDLAIAYAHHILTRRRYRRATQWYKQTYEKLGSSYTSLKTKLKSFQQNQHQQQQQQQKPELNKKKHP